MRVHATEKTHLAGSMLFGEADVRRVASDPVYTTLLLGLGFRELSVAPRHLLKIKDTIRLIHLFEAKEWSGKLLSLDSSRDIRAQ